MIPCPQRGVLMDWTCDETGRANSSALFDQLVDEVGRLIRGGASDLLCGDVDAVARRIVAHLAHRHGLAPTDGMASRAHG